MYNNNHQKFMLAIWNQHNTLNRRVMPGIKALYRYVRMKVVTTCLLTVSVRSVSSSIWLYVFFVYVFGSCLTTLAVVLVSDFDNSLLQLQSLFRLVAYVSCNHDRSPQVFIHVSSQRKQHRAQPKAEKWLINSPSHFSSYFTV